jgi:DNA mismatch endonuclease (patch repair protein)
MNLCKCGCGKECNDQYCNHHHRRGAIQSEEMKEKNRIAHLGRIPSQETREKNRKSMLGKKQTPEQIKKRVKSRSWYRPTEEIKNKISKTLTGTHLSEERKINIGIGNIGKIRSEEARKKYSKAKKGHIKTEDTIQKLKIARMYQKFVKKDTIPEKLLQTELSKRGYLYQTSYTVFGQPDIAFPEKKIAIFSDGDYWHGNPDKYKPEDIIGCGKTKSTAQNKWERDENVNKRLQKEGWIVLRYWENEIKDNCENIVDEIELFLSIKFKVLENKI